MKYEYQGESKMIVNGKKVSKGDIVESKSPVNHNQFKKLEGNLKKEINPEEKKGKKKKGGK